MTLFQLCHEQGIELKRVSSTKGGEYHSSCPSCGGKDRFIIWKEKNRYWCRQCKASGDSIQFCRDFLGLSFQDSCKKIGKPYQKPSEFNYKNKKKIFTPSQRKTPSKLWEQKAEEFVKSCHDRLLIDQKSIDLIKSRGLNIESIKKFCIGWNPENRWDDRLDWGLDLIEENGKKKKVWLPKGIVIPLYQNGKMSKIKIRRHPWSKEGKYPKYIEITGSSSVPLFIGYQPEIPSCILESELDAFLIIQEAGDLCSCLALGGAQKRPDQEVHEKLLKIPKLLCALDFDEAGKKEYMFWRKTYANLITWPSFKGKSPGDAFIDGENIYKWISLGINR